MTLPKPLKNQKCVRKFCLFLLFQLLDISFALATEENKRRTPLVIAVEKVSPAVVNIYTSETGSFPPNPFRNFGNNLFEQFFNDFIYNIGIHFK